MHVVYRTDEENVSDEQIASQIDVLNRDFRARNEDRAQVPAVWTSLVGDALVEFDARRGDAHGDRRGVLRAPTTASRRVVPPASPAG